MDLKSEFKTTKELVRHILANNPNARNSDKWLLYLVWEKELKAKGKKMFIPFEEFGQLPGIETIRRTRQKIQNEEGLYKPTEPVRKNRQERSKIIRKNIKRW